jgi:hypothetical protein
MTLSGHKLLWLSLNWFYLYLWYCRINYALSIFTCAYLSYDKFVHVNIKALPRSLAIRLIRSKSRGSLVDSASKRGTK